MTGRLQSAVAEAIEVIATLTAERLLERVAIAEFNQAIIEAIYHMEVHFALHSGQIFYATKLMTGEDLGFYKPPERAGGPGKLKYDVLRSRLRSGF